MSHRVLLFNKSQFNYLKQRLSDEGRSLYSISYFLDNKKIELLEKESVIDLSSLIGLIKSNDGIQFQLEQLLPSFPDDILFILDDKYSEDAKFYLRYCINQFDKCEIDVLEEELYDNNVVEEIVHKVKKITDFSDEEINDFINDFNNRIYGHQKFKDEFKEELDSFRVFNKIGEHKVLSLFLMGDSGVGKTEVARAIHKAFASNKKLVKINFGNYSSHDALNSLIGSPLGYIGSDGGELLKRILETDVGIILIDEFEKADSAVFNYFLDVLENGKITNTRAEEYDINGFIIIFTSNISKESFENKISPELRSRFDYVGVFNLLTSEDKIKFVKYRFSEIIKKYECVLNTQLPKNAHSVLVEKINVDKYQNMRHLNKTIKDTFVKYVEYNASIRGHKRKRN